MILHIRVCLHDTPGPVQNPDTLHTTIGEILNALDRVQVKASNREPALGGTLRAGDGKVIGSYVVEFPNG